MFPIFLAAFLLHPVHETVSEIEWNEKTGRLEVALRLDPLDEQWLRKQADSRGETSKWALKYLARKFRIADSPQSKSPDKTPAASKTPAATYHWVGRDDKESHVWWYFEIEPADGKPPRWIDQRILLERNENHINRVLVLGQVPRRALTLTIQRPRAYLNQADHEQASQSNSDSGSRLDRR